MDRIIEKRFIYGRWWVKVLSLNGTMMIVSAKTEEEAIEKALRAEPEPA